MRISRSCTAILAYVVIGHPAPAVAQVDQQRAEQYFKEAQTLCEPDGGRLWGVSLCGPMVIADSATGTIATSQPAPIVVDAKTLKGDGWTATVGPGWTVQPGPRQ